MAKYDALARHLASLPGEEWSTTFAEIERILGFALPPSATRYPAWWANQADAGHSQSQAWRAQGWQTCDLDLSGRTISFRRVRSVRGPDYAPADDASPLRRLAEEAREYSGIENEEDLMREGLKALIEREAARNLAQLGGTMPDFEAPPRRRAG